MDNNFLENQVEMRIRLVFNDKIKIQRINRFENFLFLGQKNDSFNAMNQKCKRIPRKYKDFKIEKEEEEKEDTINALLSKMKNKNKNQ